MEHTILLFLENNDLLKNSTIITDSGTDDEGSYFVPAETCFYNGGGGQEPDKGILIANGETFQILKPKWVEGALRHYLTGDIFPVKGDEVVIKVDGANRLLNNRLHSAGHLISSVVSEDFSDALITSKGFHYQQGSFVEFSRLTENIDLDNEKLITKLKKRIQDDLPIKTSIVSLASNEYEMSFKIAGFNPPADQPLRLVQVGDYMSYPCGGTHVGSTLRIGNIEIKSVKNKKGNIRVSYGCPF